MNVPAKRAAHPASPNGRRNVQEATGYNPAACEGPLDPLCPVQAGEKWRASRWQ
jgi:hypothetical protein